MARVFFLLLALLLFLLLAAAALSVPDFPKRALAKLGEGGLWTGLVVFLVMAIVLAVLPKKADGTPRK